MWTPDAMPSCSTPRERTPTRTYKEYAQIINDRAAATDAARPVRVQGESGEGHPARRGRAGEGDRQAFRHRRDVARSISTRPLDAGDRHEPHRRQEQHRRRWRGSGALPAGTEGRADPPGRHARRGARADASRPTSPEDGDSLRSRIKQVASGRFGVTAEYLNSADRSRSDGAGRQARRSGQLPGTRSASTSPSCVLGAGRGTDLAATAHDIYSIEDLAQLITTERQSQASISVKLVSEVGVARWPRRGQGQGRPRDDAAMTAAPVPRRCRRSSMRHAVGAGLAERSRRWCSTACGAHRRSGRRPMKTGRDVVIGAMLGATSSASPLRRWWSRVAS